MLRIEIDAVARRARIALAPDPSAGQPAGFDERQGDDSLGLTAREREVLALVAQGLTNRQIAERLFITPKTAGLHVSHILSKLHVDTRVKAAAIAHRAGLNAD
jgi:DNA-binding NarL/FixJ family response regulator